jgi:chaperonin GroEL (HSP60 family)
MSSDSSTRSPVESILDDETTARFDDRARSRVFRSVQDVVDVVGTTIGPYGRDKLIVNNGGNVSVTNDAATILRNLHLTDPVARVIGDLANSQIYNAGDGTTTTILFAGALLDRAADLGERGLHPTTIIRGYEHASEVALDRLRAVATTHDIADRAVAVDVAETTLRGTNATQLHGPLAELAVDAVERVTDGYDVDLNAIRLRTALGRDLADSQLVEGGTVEGVPAGEPADHPTGTITLALLDDEVAPNEASRDVSIAAENAESLSAFVDAERSRTAGLADAVSALGVDLLVCTGGVDDAVRSRLAKRGTTCLSTVSDPDMRFLSRVFGLAPRTSVDDLDPGAVGEAVVAYDRATGRTTLTTSDPGAVTVQLFGQTEAYLDEIDNTVSDAIEVVARVASDGRVLAGGGAPEMAMATRVRSDATGVDGREQLAALAFADALETVPRSIATNAGFDATDVLLSLRSAHSTGQETAGIDAETGAVGDTAAAGVREPFVVKRYAVTHAVEAVRTLLRIDGIVEAKEIEPAT